MHLTPANMLDRMLDPKLGIRTSTQGGGTPPAVPKGKDAARYFLDTHVVDMFVGYCCSHGIKAAPDGVDKVPVPPALAVPVDYGTAVLTRNRDARRQDVAERLSVFLRRPEQQAALAAYGVISARRDGVATEETTLN